MKEVGVPLHFRCLCKMAQLFWKQFSVVFFKVYLLSLFLCCVASLLLHLAFSSCREWGLLFSCGARASPWGGFSGCRAQGLGCSVVVEHELGCSTGNGIFPEKGLNLWPRHRQVGFLTTVPTGKS